MTDEDGRFTLHPPVEPIALAVEKVGFRLVSGTDQKLESADGLWDALSEITPYGWSTGMLFGAAYREMRDELLPRARSVVAVDPWHTDVRIELESLTPLMVHVYDAELGRDLGAIPEAEVRVSYGGLDKGVERLTTNPLGRTWVETTEVAWQPVLVRVSAEGFVDRWRMATEDTKTLSFGLARLAEEEASEEEPGNSPIIGRVAGLASTEQASLVAYPLRDVQRPAFEGSTEAGGRFELPPLHPRDSYTLIAYTQDAKAPRSGRTDPFHPARVSRLDVQLEDPISVPLYVANFQSDASHRIRVAYTPFRGTPEVLQRTLAVTSPSWRSEQELLVPEGWSVIAFVERQLEGNVPIVDALRPLPRQHHYRSLRTSWTDWSAVSETVTLPFAYEGSSLRIGAPEPIDVSGLVTGLPFDPPALFVTAKGPSAQWVSQVDTLGNFAFRGVPSGEYQLLLYTPWRTDTDASEPQISFDTGDRPPASLDSRGEVLGRKRVHCLGSRHDLILPYAPAEPR